MHRKQISAMETCPLNTLDERAGLNEDHDGKAGSYTDSPSISPPSSSKSKKKIRLDDDEDDQPVKDLLMYYAKNSTMHGIPTIVGSELYRGRHIFWTCVVCVMALLLGTVVYFQMRNYYDYPTVTSVDIRYVGELDFPAVTVCNLNYFDAPLVNEYLDNYTAYHLTRLTEITGLYHRFACKLLNKTQPPPISELSDVQIKQLVEETLAFVNFNVTLYCSWGNYYWTKCPAVKAKLTEMGVCATIDVRTLPRRRDNTSDEKDSLPYIGNAIRGLTMYLDVGPGEIPYRVYQYRGLKIVLHEPDEEPLPLSSGFLVSGDTTAEVEISKTVKIGLPAPFKAFGSGSCVNTQASTFQNPLSRFPKYSKEVCEAECFINYVVIECGGCKHFLHPGNESICPLDHLATCYRDAEEHYYGGHLDGTKEKSECRCPMPCTQSMYQASVTTSPFKQTKFFTDLQKAYKRNLSQTLVYMHLFYSDPVVSEMKQVAVYSTEGLLGSIGGQIGLFMGFSLVTVAEMLELIFLLVTRGRNLDERVKRHKSSEAAAQAALQA